MNEDRYEIRMILWMILSNVTDHKGLSLALGILAMCYALLMLKEIYRERKRSNLGRSGLFSVVYGKPFAITRR